MPHQEPRSMRRRFTMPDERLRALAMLATVAGLILGRGTARSADADGIALALVYDTSGSMRQPVRAADGKMAAKYLIGNRALEQIVRRIHSFVTNSSPPRTVHAGLFVFSGTRTREAVKFGPFDPPAMLGWIEHYTGPNSGTPLGTALENAAHAVLQSRLRQKHVLVITDGLNTIGPD